MFNEAEYFSLSVDLHKPQEKGKVISCIKSMPKGAHHENPKLGDFSAFERWSLINTFPEPFLHSNVPMRNFISDMFISLDYNWTASVDKLKLFSIVTYPTRMNTRDTEFPSEIILESDKCDT